MISLKEFVKETLAQITEAATEFAEETGGNPNPIIAVGSASGAEQGMFRTPDGTNVIAVDFDVAISASDETAIGAKAGVKVLSVLEVGGGGETSVTNSTISRIRFRVPLEMPVDGGQADARARREAKNVVARQRRVRSSSVY